LTEPSQGRPLKVSSSKKHLSCEKDINLFLIVLDSRIRMTPFLGIRTRYFFFFGLGSVEMIRTSHPSGLRHLCFRQSDRNTALRHIRPQKTFGTIPCSMGSMTHLMVINQPLRDSRHRRTKENDISIIAADTAAANHISWF